MTNEKKEKMGFTPEGWEQFLKNIAERFGDGGIISHDWLKEQFGLKELRLSEYETVEEFLKARDNQQFAYITIVDAVRWELLEQESMYLANVRGDGYRILRPYEQTSFAWDQLWNDLRKEFKAAEMIMTYVQTVDLWQQSKDNDIRAKFSLMKQMLDNTKK